MNCFYCEERLSDYLEDLLDASERTVVEVHLRSCSECRELLQGVRRVLEMAGSLQVPVPPPWLHTRILANTPMTVRITWRDWLRNGWRSLREPRFALSILTSALMLGWMGSVVGISAADLAIVRHPSAIYYRVDGWANRLYGDAVRSYYDSALVQAIQCQIQSRIEVLRENS